MTEYSPDYSLSSSHATVKWLFMMLRLLLILPLVTGHGHDFGPEALTRHHGLSIPQTCIQVNNKRKRCYYTFLPDCAKGHTPVVYDIHDYDDSPQSLSERSGWLGLAQQQCFIIVWPIGTMDSDEVDAPCWSMPGGMVVREETHRETTASCCCQKNNQPIFPKNQKITNHDDSILSDTTFLREIASHLVQDIPQMTTHQVTVDTKRIYLSGHGNGCWMAHAMAAYHSDMVAAVACMAGMTLTAIEPQMDTRNPYEPVPSWTIVGALDEIVPPSGVMKSSNDHGSDVDDEDIWKFPSPQTGFEYLTKLHGCQEVINHATMIPEMDIPDYPLAGALYVQTAQRCSTNNAVVQHLTLATAGHDVYQQQRKNQKQFTSTTTTTTTMSSYEAETTIDTTQLAWEFVSSFQRNQEPELLSTSMITKREKKDKDSRMQKTISNHESDDSENPLWMMAIPTSTTTIMASPPTIKSNNNQGIESESKDTTSNVNIEELDDDTHKGNESTHNYDKSLQQHQVDLEDDMILFPSQDNNQNDSNLHTNQKSITRKSLRGKIVSRFD